MIDEAQYIIKKADCGFDIEKCRVVSNKAYKVRQLVAEGDVIPASELRMHRKGQEIFMLVNIGSGSVIGTVTLTIDNRAQFNNIASITNLTVDPKYFGYNFGKRLLEHAESRAKEHQKEEVLLTIVCHPEYPAERLEAWYLKRGYHFQKNHIPERKNWRDCFKVEYREQVCYKLLSKKLTCV